MTKPTLCTLCEQTPAEDIAKSTLCHRCKVEVARYPQAFREDLTVWHVERQQKPLVMRWQRAPVTMPRETAVVIAPDEQTATVRGTRPGWIVLKARQRYTAIDLPICITCGAAINGDSATGVCRHCAMTTVSRAAAAKTQCSECGRTLKGTGVSGRCSGCSSKATKNGTQRRLHGVHGAICVSCGEAAISPANVTGLCQSCAQTKDGRVCDLCGTQPLSRRNTSGHCRSCAQREAAQRTVEWSMQAKETAA